MAIGTSVLLIAVGAILRFAVYYSVRGIDIEAIGTILMIVGVIGLLLGFTMLGPWSYRARTSRRVVNSTAGQPTTVREETIEHDVPSVSRY
jgi:xanthosine utilization system XapX-like protein